MQATRFQNISSRHAIIVIGATIIAIFIGMLIGGSAQTIASHPIPAGTLSDQEVHIRIAERVHGGERYYDAAADELRANHYGLRSIFNWRQPLYAWLIAALPNLAIARILFASLGIAGILLAARPLLRGGSAPLTLLHCWLIGMASFYCFAPWGIGAVEGWAGLLILLSVFAYADGRWAIGFVLALGALFFRELALPYIVICVALSISERRPREIIAWVVGLLLYAGYFVYHVAEIHRRMRPDDIGYSRGWIQFGGVHFILETAAQTGPLLHLPLWATGIFLPLSVLGLLAIPGTLGWRVSWTVGLYLAMFAVIGKPFNDYWGYLDAPLIAFGLPWLPPAMSDLFRSISRSRPLVPGC